MHSLWESPTRQQAWLGGGASHAVHLDVVICHIQPRQTHLTAAVEEVSCREDLTTSSPRNIITPGSPKMSNRTYLFSLSRPKGHEQSEKKRLASL